MDTLRSSEPLGRHWPISAYTVLAVNTDPTRTDTSCSICIHCDQVPIPWSWMASSILRPFLSKNHSFTYLITSHQLLLYSSSSPGPHSFNFLQPNFFDVFSLMVLFLTACRFFVFGPQFWLSEEISSSWPFIISYFHDCGPTCWTVAVRQGRRIFQIQFIF